MIRGIYTAATGMGIQQIKQESITNNLANASTTGYKKDTTVFESFPEALLARLGQDLGKNNQQVVGKTNYGGLVSDIVTNFKDGLYEDTGNPLNLALSGNAFFVVETPGGERFTRDGNFTLDKDGYLATQDGYRLKTEQGTVYVGTGDLKIDNQGQVLVSDKLVGKLNIATFNNANQLVKVGQNMFQATPQAGQRRADNYQVKQNFLEKSNINLVDEMVELMSVTKAFEANQKLIQAHDEILAKSVNELGSVK